jgi:hypothetical protein
LGLPVALNDDAWRYHNGTAARRRTNRTQRRWHQVARNDFFNFEAERAFLNRHICEFVKLSKAQVPLAKYKANPDSTPVAEGRKRVLLVAAGIVAARKLAQLESTRPSPVLNSAIHNSIILVERIIKKIDDLFPSRT